MKGKVFILVSVLALAGMASAVVVMDLDASTLGLADGAAVSSWTDTSGNGNHATQGTAGAQPTYVASNPAFNGDATVSFDGSDLLDLNGSMITVDNFTLFIVGNFDVTGVNQYMISAQGGSGNDRLRVANYSWGSGFMTRIGNTGDKNLAPIDTSAHVIAVTGTSDAWFDLGAKQVVGNNTAGALNPSHFALGCYNDATAPRDFFTGDLARVILYNEILSDVDIEAMNAQLIPEPATMALLGLGAMLIRRKR